MAYQFELIERRRIECGGELCPPPPGEVEREPPVCPQDDRSSHEDGEKHRPFGSNGHPKDGRIADRGKPQPIDQEVIREPQ
jgi:hypothetical protein